MSRAAECKVIYLSLSISNHEKLTGCFDFVLQHCSFDQDILTGPVRLSQKVSVSCAGDHSGQTESDSDRGLVRIDDGVVVHATVVTQPDGCVQVRIAAGAVHHALKDVDGF